MTDDQFKELMKKLEEIERKMVTPGQWPQYVAPIQPSHPWDGLPPHWIGGARD